MRHVKYVFMLLILLLTTGCWDKEELENRGFVVSMGIDTFQSDAPTGRIDAQSGQNRYLMSMTLPSISELEGEGDEEAKSMKKGSGETVSGTIRNISAHSSKKIDFGHAKTCIFGEEILSDESLFQEALDALERNTELNGKLIILATDERAEDILAAKVTDDPIIGLFISNFYKKNASSTAMAFRNDLQKLVQDLRNSGSAIIPKITLEDDKLHLGGAAVIKNVSFVGWLDDEAMKGYLWAKSSMLGEQISVEKDGIYIPLEVTKKKSDTMFTYQNGMLSCIYFIEAQGDIEEYTFSKGGLFNQETLSALERIYEQKIVDDVEKTWRIFQKKYQTDGFSLQEELKRKHYELYKTLETSWEDVFENMELIVLTDVRIQNAGAIQ